MLMYALFKLLRPKYNIRKMSFKKGTVKVYVADSFIKRMFGLMYRKRLDKNSGMLFILGRESREGTSVWMLNMNFSIDIVWIDKHGRVVDVVENANPCSSVFNCKAYTPAKKSKYILELCAGSVAELKIRTGDKIMS